MIFSRQFITILFLTVLCSSIPLISFAAPSIPAQPPVAGIQTENTIDQLRERVNQAIGLMLNKLSTRESSIQSNQKLRTEAKNDLLGTVQETRGFLLQQQQALIAAQDVNTVRTVATTIREFMQKQKNQLQQKRTSLVAKNTAAIIQIQSSSNQLIRILQRGVRQLQEDGIATSELQAKIALLQESITELSQEQVKSDPKKFKDAIGSIRDQLSGIIDLLNEGLTQNSNQE